MVLHRFLLVLATISFTYVCGNYYTPTFSGSMQNISAERGQDVSFTCSIEHLGKKQIAFLKVDPLTVIAYHHAYHKTFTTKLHKYRLENRRDVTHDHWSLIINNVQKADAGAYVCQVGSIMSQTAFLTLKVPPIINDRSTSEITVKENQNLTMVCSADGSPSPSISWKRADDAIIITNEPVEGFGVGLIAKSNLTIYKVSRRHMGDYVCLADNGIQPADGWSVKLHVHFAPTVEAVEQRVVKFIGSDAKLQCKSEAWPLPEFRWLFNEHLILTNNTKYQQITGSSTTDAVEKPYDYESLNALIVRRLNENDFGAYSCIAKNNYGENKASVELIKDETSFESTLESKEDDFSGAHSDNNDVAKLDDEAKDDFDDEKNVFEDDSVKKILNVLNDGRNIKSDDPPENSSGLHSLPLPIIYIFSIIIIRLASSE